jgi:hypothetical protein
MARKNFTPIHPLAMAQALEEINSRAGLLLATIQSVQSVADGADADMCRKLLGRIADAADNLRAVIWPDEEN